MSPDTRFDILLEPVEIGPLAGRRCAEELDGAPVPEDDVPFRRELAELVD